KGRDVAVEATLVFQTTLDEIEGDLWQAPAGQAVQIFDIDGVVQSHRARFSLKKSRCGAKLLRIFPHPGNPGFRRAGPPPGRKYRGQGAQAPRPGSSSLVRTSQSSGKKTRPAICSR